MPGFACEIGKPLRTSNRAVESPQPSPQTKNISQERCSSASKSREAPLRKRGPHRPHRPHFLFLQEMAVDRNPEPGTRLELDLNTVIQSILFIRRNQTDLFVSSTGENSSSPSRPPVLRPHRFVGNSPRHPSSPAHHPPRHTRRHLPEGLGLVQLEELVQEGAKPPDGGCASSSAVLFGERTRSALPTCPADFIEAPRVMRLWSFKKIGKKLSE